MAPALAATAAAAAAQHAPTLSRRIPTSQLLLTTALLSTRAALSSTTLLLQSQEQIPAWREHAAIVVGFVSIACWVIVYTPQLLENYRNKSAEGLSTAFVLIWLAGDALNWLGALLQGLLWTQIALAGYYVFCDIALLWQAYYYTKYYLNGVRIERHPLAYGTIVPTGNGQTETTPLLHGQQRINHGHNHSVIAASGGGAHPSASTITTGGARSASALSISRRPSRKSRILLWTTAVGFVAAVGVIAYFVFRPTPSNPKPPHYEPPNPEGPGAGVPVKHKWRWDAQIYGWLSALLYLTSRIPQIIKNRKTYCEGLSMALFVFALGGNSTYVASILLRSLDRDYLLENASWLVGSLGVVFLDFVVLAQFVRYAPERAKLRVEVDAAAAAEAEAAALAVAEGAVAGVPQARA
ncbi:hypothetical protein V8E36_005204 [Tilletia maclaganii]